MDDISLINSFLNANDYFKQSTFDNNSNNPNEYITLHHNTKARFWCCVESSINWLIGITFSHCEPSGISVQDISIITSDLTNTDKTPVLMAVITRRLKNIFSKLEFKQIKAINYTYDKNKSPVRLHTINSDNPVNSDYRIISQSLCWLLTHDPFISKLCSLSQLDDCKLKLNSINVSYDELLTYV